MSDDDDLGPVASRRKVRSELRRERENNGLTQDEAASRLGWSRSKIMRIETGASGISPADLRKLLRFYGVSNPRRVDRLADLAKRTRKHGWWAGYRKSVDPGFFTYVGLEGDATELRFFASTGVPGLLQTSAYARAVMSLWSDDIAKIEQAVELRMRRQKQFFGRPDSPKVTVLLDEAIFSRTVGDIATMRDQMKQLLAVAARPSIVIRVLPFQESYPCVAVGPFTIMYFSQPDDALVYFEEVLASRTTDNPTDVQFCEDVLRRGLATAFSEAKTQNVIHRLSNRM